MSKKLSIIVPIYNTEKYLNQCIESIVNQEYQDFTLILVDDGSTDSSGKLCDQWAQRDSRIVVYHKANGGLMSAWKYGFMRSDTEYVGFVDADDWIDGNMYAKLLQEAEKHQSEIVACGWIGDFGDGKNYKKEMVKLAGNTFDKEQISSTVYPILISGGNYHWMGISPNRWTKIYKRELLQKNIVYCDDRVSIGEDLLINFCTIPNTHRMTIMKDFFPYHYRIHSESMIHKYSDENYKKIVLLYENLIKVNNDLEYDFTTQINTYYIKLLLAQLENEILFAKKNYKQIKERMKKVGQSINMHRRSEKTELHKLPFKYRLYIRCLQLHCYALLFFIRKAKRP